LDGILLYIITLFIRSEERHGWDLEEIHSDTVVWVTDAEVTHLSHFAPATQESIRTRKKLRRRMTIYGAKSRPDSPFDVFVQFCSSFRRLFVEEELVVEPWDRRDESFDGDEGTCRGDILLGR
jgi:hypothetical protein